MSVNVSNIELLLVQKIQSSSSTLDLLQYTKSLEMLKTGAIVTVPTFSSLPSTLNIAEGVLYFVESDRSIYTKTNGVWRLLSQNIPTPVFAWGCNTHGQLGDNTVVHKSSPVRVVSGFTDWCQVSAGTRNTAAIRTNGTLWTWGCNSWGQLGDNTVVAKSSPVSVAGGFTDWCQVGINPGANHTAALRTNGTLWTWGSNACGILGDNTVANKSSPVSVVGGFTDWCQISVGTSHSAAIRTNGTLWTWGSNSYGALGHNTATTCSRSSPVSVVGGFTDWCQVSVGNIFTAAVRTNGTIWTWGLNNNGQLGDNTVVCKSSPVGVVGGFTNWCQVSAGPTQTAAIRTNGTIWTWGFNVRGQLGDNTVINKSSPVSVVGGFTDWCQISVGGLHIAALRTNGTLWTWGGNNNCGQLGDNTVADKSSPVSVDGGFTDWCQISASTIHNIALRVSGF